MDGGFHHRSSQKQQNKSFKSKHATKGQIKSQNKGKVERTAAHSVKNKTRTRLDRKNQARLIQKNKRDDVLSSNRLFIGSNSTPKILAVVPLCPDTDSDYFAKSLFESMEVEMPDTPGPLNLILERFKQKLQIIRLKRNLLDILDAVKVADYVVFLMSAEVEVDAFGDLCLATIKGMAVPQPVHIVQHIPKVPAKKQEGIRKSLISYMSHHFPGEPKIFTTDTPTEAVNVIRYITSQRPKGIAWRDRQAYMLCDSVDFESGDDDETGTLKITGYVRGSNFSANRLVHLQNFGDFQITKITAATAPGQRDVNMDAESTVLDSPDPINQESLVSENDVDPMEGEQTWPTEEELAEADERVKLLTSEQGQRKKKLVPKGTSAYQAAWIVDKNDEEDDEDDDDQDGSDSNDDDDNIMASDDQWASVKLGNTNEISDDDASEESVEYEEVDVEDKDALLDAEFNEEQENADYLKHLEKQRQSREDLEFPDEVDTPQHIPARVRFQRYRGLKSFRTSPWDPYENLPVDYARIFQFENLRRTKKRVFQLVDSELDGVVVGMYVTVHLANAPRKAIDTYDPARPFVAFTILPHEHKMSILNFLVQRNTENTDAVKSKDPVVIHCGLRRFVVSPIYSSASRNSTNNVQKFERYLQPGSISIGTVFAPIQFGPAPLLMFKYEEGMGQTPDKPPTLLGVGSVVDCDTKRIIAKRIILTGHPFKVNKRSAVIRFMFFNPEDIAWFRPIQLTTKMGRKGHIKESLGTHGHMKCVFDGPLKSHDTVCMYLYKRVFPKWTTRLYIDGTITREQDVKDDEMQI
ncbi:uncharacterized protein BJ171DRAFT_441509 [Polychytrium aggregatum]|uniref:uncharacterized protein n=1 Tax=Polychytrium aggregatum TaxID=110093 RepID=UPI0022FEF1E5|nr:uncharacterized protein BJ171DRAFT_441509 [Polychytrium aggregatum]KAI9205299.1 hypothetical protein BJ171DRAFT_441509 [Polychytrium aggregatum]